MRKTNALAAATAAVFSSLIGTVQAPAQPKYDPGANDKEIIIGATAPYSGPVSAVGAIANAMASYFNKINDDGGINGRKINFKTVDDGYSPPKTVEGIRRLVESDEVLFIAGMAGTAPASAVRQYLNAKKIPQLFVVSGASKFGDPANYPWTMAWNPDQMSEGIALAQYILKNVPDPKVAILYQNDDFGKDILAGFRRGFGDKASSVIVKEASYETTLPTIDGTMIGLEAENPNVIVIGAAGRAAIQAIRQTGQIGFKGMRVISGCCNNVETVLRPAGLENAKGLISSGFLKFPYLAEYDKDKGVQDYRSWLAKYSPQAKLEDDLYVTGYSIAQTVEAVLRKAGDNLTRENIMKQAASLDLELPMLLPGVRFRTSPSDFYPLQSLQLSKFDGERWQRLGLLTGAKQ